MSQFEVYISEHSNWILDNYYLTAPNHVIEAEGAIRLSIIDRKINVSISDRKNKAVLKILLMIKTASVDWFILFCIRQ